MFGAHLIVVKAVGLLAGKRQDLLRTWCEVIHHVNVRMSAVPLRMGYSLFDPADSLSFARMNFLRKGRKQKSARFSPKCWRNI